MHPLPWLLAPYKSRGERLDGQSREILKLWRKLSSRWDVDKHSQTLRDALLAAKRPDLLQDLVHLISIDAFKTDKILANYLLEKFGVFTRKCFDDFLLELKWAHFDQFFPLRVLCLDFIGVKQMNSLTGDYAETDKVVGHELDIAHYVARNHRFEARGEDFSPDRRTFPDLIFQYNGGDEFVIILPRARSLTECDLVESQYHQMLADEAIPKPLIRTSDKRWAYGSLRVTCSSCEILSPDEDAHEALRQGFAAVLAKKALAKKLLQTPTIRDRA